MSLKLVIFLKSGFQISILTQSLGKLLQSEKAHASYSGLAKVAVQCSADTFVVNQSFVLRIKICGENRHLRQAAKR